MKPHDLALLQPNTLFHERYRIIHGIGAGAMGAVYEIEDEVTNRRRALKVMLPSVIHDPELRARFVQEARITGSVESDHIVQVFDAGVDAGSGMPFLVMELLRGEQLGAMSARRGPLPPREVSLYLSQVALALDKTHAAAIVHRDLKPENLFLTTRDDERGRPARRGARWRFGPLACDPRGRTGARARAEATAKEPTAARRAIAGSDSRSGPREAERSKAPRARPSVSCPRPPEAARRG